MGIYLYQKQGNEQELSEEVRVGGFEKSRLSELKSSKT